MQHCRLGHPSTNLQNQVLKIIDVSHSSSSELCSSCQLGKAHRLPFTCSESRSNKPLELLHCDVWGSAPVLNRNGFKYYALLVDDFSRYTWFFPMKAKSDFFDVFIQFRILAEKLFNSVIRMIRTDGGGEFVNNNLKSYLVLNGISHQLSCPHTPEQNGIAERKHRHIVETGLSLMAEASVPSSFWLEAFQTSVYLINRLPITHSNKTPYFLMFGKHPDYHFLKIFGCLCYPWIRPYNHNKLEFRSLPCVFLGYNNVHKGYQCLHIPTARVYTSRHVRFDESCYPFNNSKSLSTSDKSYHSHMVDPGTHFMAVTFYTIYSFS